MQSTKAPVSHRWRRHRWTVVSMVVVAVLAIVYQALRIPVLEHDVVWAEDGHEFLHFAVGDDPAGTVFQPYQGYQHFVPRVLALLITGLTPMESYAAVVFWVCVVLSALICAATVWLARWSVPWLPARIALGMIPVVVPLMAPEIIGNLADFHTFLLWLGVWIVLSKPSGRAESWFWAVILLMAVLTEVQLVLILPIVLLRIRRSQPDLWPIIGAALVGIAAQIATWVLSPRVGYEGEAPGLDDVVVGWLASTVVPLIRPSELWWRQALIDDGIIVALPYFLIFAVAALVALVFGSWRMRFVAIAVLLVGACSWGGSVIVSPIEAFQYASFEGEDWNIALIDVRYGGAAGMFLAAIVPMAAAACAPRLRGNLVAPGRVVLALGVAGFVGLMAVQSPDAGSHRFGVQAWSEQVDQAQAACAVDGEPEVMFLGPFNREMTLDCDDLNS